MTLDRTHRYFGETLQGGTYWAFGRWMVSSSFVAAVNDGQGLTVNLYGRSPLLILCTEPTLLHSASELNGQSHYDRVQQVGRRLLVLSSGHDEQDVMLFHPAHTLVTMRTQPRGCGLIHFQRPRRNAFVEHRPRGTSLRHGCASALDLSTAFFFDGYP